jgi:primosomal replication protein N
MPGGMGFCAPYKRSTGVQMAVVSAGPQWKVEGFLLGHVNKSVSFELHASKIVLIDYSI